jgi:hypothetical protein
MDQNDEFRRYAAEAQKWADTAESDYDRAAWLGVVQGWLSLLRKRSRTEVEAFEARSRAIDPGQGNSEELH